MRCKKTRKAATRLCYDEKNACYTSSSIIVDCSNSPFFIIAFGAVEVFIILSMLEKKICRKEELL